MKLLVRMADDNGMPIGNQPETMIEPTLIEDRGIQTVYKFEIEYHEFNEEAYHKYLREQEEVENETS